jgi:hypothetical protein
MRLFHKKSKSIAALEAVTDLVPPVVRETALLKTIGWISAGAGALAFGLFLGRELRQRYKFTRRTPYDFYSHSGDPLQDVEFGVGI